MKKLRKAWKEKIDLSIIYKCFLVILDMFFINLSSFLALWIRFNMHISEIEPWYSESVLSIAVWNTLITLGIFAVLKLYSSLWRFASIKELVYVIEACACSVLVNIFLYFFTYKPIYRSYFILYGVSLFLLTCISRFSYRLVRLLYRSNIHGRHMRNTMIIGAGEACNVVMKELELSRELDANIRCIIDDDPRKHGTYIHGVKVVGDRDQIVPVAEKYGSQKSLLRFRVRIRENREKS